MNDDDLCVCFHVPAHKIVRFIRRTRPRYPSQCSECGGAGTGCGWCIPFIEKIFERMADGEDDPATRMGGDEYRARRIEYLRRIRMDRMRPDSDGIGMSGRLDDALLEEDPDTDDAT